MTDELVAWFPDDTRAVVAAPEGKPAARVVDAYATVEAIKVAAQGMQDRLRGEVKRQAAVRRAEDGGKWRGVEGAHAQASDTYSRRRLVVAEHERLAAWLAEHDPDAHAQSVVETDRYEVDGVMVERILLMLRSDADAMDGDGGDLRPGDYTASVLRTIANNLAGAVQTVTSVTVDVEALLAITPRRYVAAGTHVATVDGEPLPGVTVIPAAFKHVTVRPDREYVEGMAAVIERAVIGQEGT